MKAFSVLFALCLTLLLLPLVAIADPPVLVAPFFYTDNELISDPAVFTPGKDVAVFAEFYDPDCDLVGGELQYAFDEQAPVTLTIDDGKYNCSTGLACDSYFFTVSMPQDVGAHELTLALFDSQGEESNETSRSFSVGTKAVHATKAGEPILSGPWHADVTDLESLCDDIVLPKNHDLQFSFYFLDPGCDLAGGSMWVNFNDAGWEQLDELLDGDLPCSSLDDAAQIMIAGQTSGLPPGNYFASFQIKTKGGVAGNVVKSNFTISGDDPTDDDDDNDNGYIPEPDDDDEEEELTGDQTKDEEGCCGC